MTAKSAEKKGLMRGLSSVLGLRKKGGLAKNVFGKKRHGKSDRAKENGRKLQQGTVTVNQGRHWSRGRRRRREDWNIQEGTGKANIKGPGTKKFRKGLLKNTGGGKCPDEATVRKDIKIKYPAKGGRGHVGSCELG